MAFPETSTRVATLSAATMPPRRTFSRARASSSSNGSDRDLEPVVGDDHLQGGPVLADQLLVADRLGVHPLDILIRIGRLVVKERQAPGAGRQAEVDRN